MSGLRGLLWIASLALLAALPSTAFAGAASPCSKPVVFDSNVQVHIFPFTAESALTREARALATLLQRHVLFAALKYPSIGVQELLDDDSPCSFGQVAGRISAGLRPDQTAIFLRGRIFEQDGVIYLKSFVDVKAPAARSEIRWPLALDAAADARVAVTTVVPLAIESFAPRAIPVSFLERLQPSQIEARRVHAEPSGDSPFQELPDGTGGRYTFLVFQARDDWMRVRVLPFGIEGWMPAHALAGGDLLKGEFPELYFVDALVGYFALSGKRGDNARILERTRQSFERYLSVTGNAAEPDARALARVLMGNARLLAAGDDWDEATLGDAQRDYRRAVQESPTWSPARAHLLADTTLLCARGSCEGGAAALESAYLEAIARDPLSIDLVNGLGGYYQVAGLNRLTTGLATQELKARAEKVRAVQARMSRP